MPYTKTTDPVGRPITFQEIDGNIDETIYRLGLKEDLVNKVLNLNAPNDVTYPSTSAIAFALGLKLNVSLLGAANGVAPLDAGGKISFQHLPATLLIYKGAYNVSTSLPVLVDGASTPGFTYRVTGAPAAVNINLGSGALNVTNGDYLIYNPDGIWEKIDGSDSVTSVNGMQGVISLTTDNIPEGANLYYTNARVKAHGDILYEPIIAVKNTAFNKNFGVTAGTVAQGNDLRINNGQTAFSWGNFADRILTINGVAQNLSIDRAWSVGTVTNVTGTLNRVTVATGTTIPVIDIAATYVGQASITTLGTVATGVWQGTVIADAYISSASIWNAKQNALGGTGFVKSTAGAITYDTNSYVLLSPGIAQSGFINMSGNITAGATILGLNGVFTTSIANNAAVYSTGGYSILVKNTGNNNYQTVPSTTYELSFVKNTGFNKNLGSTAGTVLEGRTFGTAANNNTGDFYPSGNPSGYISSFSEVDTLATVTGRAATTTVLSTFNGGIVGTTATFNGRLSAMANMYISSAAPTLLFTDAVQTTTFGYIQYSGGNVNYNSGTGSHVFQNALTGTSATFTGKLGIGALSSHALFNISTGNDNQMAIGTTAINQTAAIFFADGAITSSVGYKWELGKDNNNNFFIYSYGTASVVANLNYANGRFTTSSTSPYANNVSSTTTGCYTAWTANGVIHGYVGSANQIVSGGNASDFGISSSNGFQLGTGASLTLALTIASNQAATFTSTVTAAGGFFNSDERWKTFNNETFDLSALQARSFRWNDFSKKDDMKNHFGYKAQDVQKYMPDAVSADENGYLSVNYTEVLVAKVQKLEDEVRLLKARLYN